MDTENLKNWKYSQSDILMREADTVAFSRAGTAKVYLGEIEGFTNQNVSIYYEGTIYHKEPTFIELAYYEQ